MAGLSKGLQTSPQCRKARQAFHAEIALVRLTGILVIALTSLQTRRYMTQLMKVRKLWVRVSKVPESPPSSSVAGTLAATEEASCEII